MKTYLKTHSLVLAFALLLAGNFCRLECAFSSPIGQVPTEVSAIVIHTHGHGTDADGDAHSHGDEDGCAAFLAEYDTTYTVSAEPHQPRVIHAILAETLRVAASYRAERKFDFPPGVLSHTPYLSNCLSHAPPSVC